MQNQPVMLGIQSRLQSEFPQADFNLSLGMYNHDLLHRTNHREHGVFIH